MKSKLGKTIKKLRIKKGFSQIKLADMLFVTHSTVARWESGSRLPDASMIIKIADCLDVDVDVLFTDADEIDSPSNIIIVDDEKIILEGSVSILKKAIPNANIYGFSTPSEALEYARKNEVALAFLDIKMGRVSGLNVCRELLKINPKTNIIYLTAYREYSFDAWSTGACGFLLKPLTVDSVKDTLSRLPHPLKGVEI